MSVTPTHVPDLVDDAWQSDEAWAAKMADDRTGAHRVQTPAQRKITKIVVRRAVADGAAAVALTGSTARRQRTAISDLDYHVVGAAPKHDDLPGDVDIYTGAADAFWKKLHAGDDFVQWTLRHGLLLVDDGTFRAGLRAIAAGGLWPDPEPKLKRLPSHYQLIARLLAMEDCDAAQTELRAALTSAARAVLLAAEIFPLARAELPAQLRAIARSPLADALEATIESKLSLVDLRNHAKALAPFAGRSALR